jgi:hypothetical protein
VQHPLQLAQSCLPFLTYPAGRVELNNYTTGFSGGLHNTAAILTVIKTPTSAVRKIEGLHLQFTNVSHKVNLITCIEVHCLVTIALERVTKIKL